MLRHYLTIAVRNARRTPLAAAVNVLTLAVGLVSVLCAYGFVAYLERAERAFPNADRIYVLTASFAFLDGRLARSNLTHTPEAAAELLALDFPELERVARAIPLRERVSISTSERALRLAVAAADPELFELFPLPFAAGDARAALREPGSAVLTRAAAERLFGAVDVLGRPLTIANGIAATVTGVIDSLPEPSHIGSSDAAPLELEVLVSLDVRDAIERATLDPRTLEFLRQGWTGGAAITYLLFRESAAGAAMDVEQRLADFVVRRVPEQQRADVDLKFGLLPVRDFLHKSVDEELFSSDYGTSVSTVLLGLGALVLGVACVNYATLAAARSARRLREVGIRKALGAAPLQVALQHLLEAGLLTGIALACALGLLWAALPALETVSGMRIGAVLVGDPQVWLLVAAVGAAAALAAGAYPGLALARVDSIVALRASLARFGARGLTAVLVGAQFGAAGLIVIALTVMTLQNRKLVETGLGVVEDPIVMIENDSRVTHVDARTLRAELGRLPEVRGVTEGNGLPWQRLVLVTFLRPRSDESSPVHRVLVRSVGYDFFRVMDIHVLAGRVFDPAYGDDVSPEELAASGRPGSIVVDRAFVEQFGLGSPEEAIGRLVYPTSGTPAQVVGVVENRRLTFRGAGATAVQYGLTPAPNVTYVRIAPQNIGRALDAIDAVWNRLAPNVAIARSFFDEAFDEAYERFLRLNQIFGVLAVLALAIATAGVVGMATLVTAQRRREVGVRKVMGATAASIVRMLLATFLLPVIVANAVVWPIGYFAAREYLSAFLDPVELGASPFAAALGVTLAAAALASAAQTVRTARVRPAEVLRDE